MAALFAVLSAVARSAWRSLRGLGSFTGNNLFAVIVLLMAEEPLDRPSSTAVFYLFIGLLYTVPLALELERRIPRVRLALWPLTPAQRAVLTAVNLMMNPVLGLSVLFAMLSRHPAVGSALLLAALATPPAVLLGEAASRWMPDASRLPKLPMLPGRLGGLVLNHLREMLRSLDVYLAGCLSLGGIVYRFAAQRVDPSAALVMGGLIIVLISTLAQYSGGFDPEASATRLRLLPVSGAQLLLARDVAWLLITLALVVTNPPAPCIAGAFAALAVGHATVTSPPLEQKRGHFAAGRLGPTGLYQIAAIAIAFALVSSFGPLVVVPVVAIWGYSTWWFGRRLSTAA